MASSLFKGQNDGGLLSRLKDALSIINGRDPETAVRAYLARMGVSPQQMDTALKQAQNILNDIQHQAPVQNK